MALSKKEFTQYVRAFKFKELFNDMGWENDKTNQSIAVDNVTYPLIGVAEKRGFRILLCYPGTDGLIPNYPIRRKIETRVTKLFQEHLIIFFDEKNQEQIWQLVVRQIGKPTKITETQYHISQDPELLFQRASGILFELNEEGKITIVDVTQRITENFHQNNERVTKQFYETFSNEHESFLKFIKGIEDKVNKEWYASLMLNRLMFCYFIQKKGFLDNNRNYLLDKLKASQEKKGKNKFYSFYRSFLLTLFHQGLGTPDHSKEVQAEIGKVPYLNGGLFEEHELETSNPKIDIDDKAFERIFDFFDQYEWHLDTRHTASGKDINPDVIGYIFEKYINDRAQMGAYYTKEDITDYISKNCLFSYLFDEIKRHYPKVFAPEGEIWQMVRASADRYIYDAVKYGINESVPSEIAKGSSDVASRTEWNKPAPPEFGLPTEIWREVLDRRSRYEDLKTKIKKGDVTSINDFVTYNLNIGQFVQDVVENTSDTEFLKVFYKSISSVTIIDPTCGSGAFLFAAMNILQPLYESSIMRMRAFVEDEDRTNTADKATFKHRHKFFREVLEHIQSPQHPNLSYFIYKSIILRNLYGVDIMREAVEIAKLRLFLRLVATVEADYRKPNLGLEPLPDIDFNIRAGNTLIGFANAEELGKGLTYTLDGLMAQPVIEEKCDVVAKVYTRYKEIQLTYGDDYKQFKKAKEELNKRLKELNHELNQLLYKQTPTLKYDKWLDTHQPFHWFAEFYEIIQERGGFDVVIGNPPYVEYSDVKNTYTLKSFISLSAGNLYSFVLERSISIGRNSSFIGMIVPISSISTPRMNILMKLITSQAGIFYASNYAVRPGKLFVGADMNLSILLFNKIRNGNTKSLFSSDYNRWNGESRNQLFQNLKYSQIDYDYQISSLPKVGSPLSLKVWNKIQGFKNLTKHAFENYDDEVFYHSGGRYFRKCYHEKLSNEYKSLMIPKGTKYNFISLLSSSLYYWYWIVVSDTYHVTQTDINYFPFPQSILKDEELKKLGRELILDLDKNSVKIERKRKDGSTSSEMNFFVSKSKRILDKIDTVLAKHYGLTIEELDYVINYDIKYRIGKDDD